MISNDKMSEFQERLLSLKKRFEGNLTPKYNKILNRAIRELERPENKTINFLIITDSRNFNNKK
jgi:hypothetical protein